MTNDSPSAALVYGIDIGDWNCGVAIGRQHTTLDILATDVLPSAVAVRPDGTYLAGWSAYHEMRHDATRYRRGLNRDFGQDDRIWLGAEPVDPAQLMSLLLREVRAAAAAAVPGQVARVAIAVPPGWAEGRRAALLETARGAGFDPGRVVLVDRPIATATPAAESIAGEVQRHILVYDLGATSFACALVRRTGAGRLILVGQPNVRTDLGGALFDLELVASMATRSPGVQRLLDAAAPDASAADDSARDDPARDDPARDDPACGNSAADDSVPESSAADVDRQHRIAAVWSLAENIKLRLSSQPQVQAYVTAVQPGFTFEVDRARFNETIRLSVAATIANCDGLLTRQDRTWSDVDIVVAAGGGSNLPLVQQALGAAWGRPVDPPMRPELAVARGAAAHAGQAVRALNEMRQAAADREARRPVPVTGRLERTRVSPPLLSAALLAWSVWAASGGWFTITHWHGVWMWLTLLVGVLMPVVLCGGYVRRAETAAVASAVLGGAVVLVHVVALVVVGYRAIFTKATVGWIPFVGTATPAVAAACFAAAAVGLMDPIDTTARITRWAANRRVLVRRVQQEKRIGSAPLPAVVDRLVDEFGAARAFGPTGGPFTFAIAMGRTLLLVSTEPGALPAAEDVTSAIDGYLGPPSSVPMYAQAAIERFAQRPINVHCFLTGELDEAAQEYLAAARTWLLDRPARRSTGQPAASATLAIVHGGDLETRLRRLLERADRELYLPLLERAAEAAGLTG